MQDRSSTHHLVRIFLVAAMAWGFAVPIVHLACGMSAPELELFCDEEMETRHGDHDTVRHFAPADDMHQHGAAETQAATLSHDDSVVECCEVDADAVDHVAPVQTPTQVPVAAVTAVDTSVQDDLREMQISSADDEPDAAPPVAFRLLFSVFLI